ncbi:MAG: aromatic amino acid lyase, partial [Bacteroidetes Order II. Incertae sedis bacterium]|nr:aromatic amino acid lyase [Bacteroidetes Order II. bacterium]
MSTLTIRTLYDDIQSRLDELSVDSSAVSESRNTLDRVIAGGEATYGVNTGFGKLANKRIDDNDLSTLQRNLLVSHAVGVGDPVPREITAIMLALKVHALGMGYSGVSETTFGRLLEFSRSGMIPVVPTRGSVGASGDLAPLAHMSLPLIGLGYFWSEDGKHIPAAEALAAKGLSPIELQAKDGLSLINGTQFMAAYGAYVMERAVKLVRTADILATMSLEALQGSSHPFDEKVHAVRPHPGQITVAKNLRLLLKGSKILESHRDCGKVQDPYCLRCVPQVHGASRDALTHILN